MVVETANNAIELPNNIDYDTEEHRDITILIDTAGVDDLFDSINKDNNSVIEDAQINARDINAPANASSNDDNTSNTSDLPVIY